MMMNDDDYISMGMMTGCTSDVKDVIDKCNLPIKESNARNPLEFWCRHVPPTQYNFPLQFRLTFSS